MARTIFQDKTKDIYQVLCALQDLEEQEEEPLISCSELARELGAERDLKMEKKKHPKVQQVS